MKRGRSPEVSLYSSQASVEPPRTPTGTPNTPSSRKIMKVDSLSSEDEEGELPKPSSSASPKKGSGSPKKGKGTPWTVAEDRVIMEAIVKTWKQSGDWNQLLDQVNALGPQKGAGSAGGDGHRTRKSLVMHWEQSIKKKLLSLAESA